MLIQALQGVESVVTEVALVLTPVAIPRPLRRLVHDWFGYLDVGFADDALGIEMTDYLVHAGSIKLGRVLRWRILFWLLVNCVCILLLNWLLRRAGVY